MSAYNLHEVDFATDGTLVNLRASTVDKTLAELKKIQNKGGFHREAIANVPAVEGIVRATKPANIKDSTISQSLSKVRTVLVNAGHERLLMEANALKSLLAEYDTRIAALAAEYNASRALGESNPIPNWEAFAAACKRHYEGICDVFYQQHADGISAPLWDEMVNALMLLKTVYAWNVRSNDATLMDAAHPDFHLQRHNGFLAKPSGYPVCIWNVRKQERMGLRGPSGGSPSDDQDDAPVDGMGFLQVLSAPAYPNIAGPGFDPEYVGKELVRFYLFAVAGKRRYLFTSHDGKPLLTYKLVDGQPQKNASGHDIVKFEPYTKRIQKATLQAYGEAIGIQKIRVGQISYVRSRAGNLSFAGRTYIAENQHHSVEENDKYNQPLVSPPATRQPLQEVALEDVPSRPTKKAKRASRVKK